jgi:hypothetical protein
VDRKKWSIIASKRSRGVTTINDRNSFSLSVTRAALEIFDIALAA